MSPALATRSRRSWQDVACPGSRNTEIAANPDWDRDDEHDEDDKHDQPNEGGHHGEGPDRAGGTADARVDCPDGAGPSRLDRTGRTESLRCRPRLAQAVCRA